MIGSFFAQNYQFCKIFTGSAKPIVKNGYVFILAVRRKGLLEIKIQDRR